MTTTKTCSACKGTGWDAAFGSQCYCGAASVGLRAKAASTNFPAEAAALTAKAEALAAKASAAVVDHVAETVVAEALTEKELATWLSEQTWSEFAQSLAAAWRKYGTLTPKQRAAAESMRTKCEARAAQQTPKVAANPVTEPGMYVHPDGRIVRVQASRGDCTRLYGKVLVDDQFEYAPSIVRDLTADMRMTSTEAALYGRRTGRCCVCAAELTDPKSVERGIGPICAGRL